MDGIGKEDPASAVDDTIRRLIELHADKAYAIAFRMTGNAADAGDLAQEAFLRAMKYHHSYDQGLPFEGWIYQIIRNIYLGSLEREARRRSVPLSHSLHEDSLTLEEVLPDPAPGPERAAETAGTGAEVRAALETLSPPLKMAVVLVDLEGVEREDAARALGCSISALDVRLHRARAALRKKFEERQ